MLSNSKFRNRLKKSPAKLVADKSSCIVRKVFKLSYLANKVDASKARTKEISINSYTTLKPKKSSTAQTYSRNPRRGIYGASDGRIITGNAEASLINPSCNTNTKQRNIGRAFNTFSKSNPLLQSRKIPKDIGRVENEGGQKEHWVDVALRSSLWLKRRNEKVAKWATDGQSNELMECTFQPHLKKSIRNSRNNKKQYTSSYKTASKLTKKELSILKSSNSYSQIYQVKRAKSYDSSNCSLPH